MNGIDVIFIIVLFLLGVRGLLRGLVREIFSTLSLLLGAVAAALFYKPVAALFSAEASPNAWYNIFAFLLIFIGVLLIVRMMERGLADLLRLTSLTGFDKGLGLVLGLLEGVIVCCLLVVAIRVQSFYPSEKLLSDSLLVPYLVQTIPLLRESGKKILEGITPEKG